MNKNLPVPQSLYLHPNSVNFVETNSTAGTFRMNAGQIMELYCTENFLNVESSSNSSGASIFVSCAGLDQFRMAGNYQSAPKSLSQFNCTGMPKHTTQRTSRQCNGGQIIEIGFQIFSRWIPVLEICFNQTSSNTHWVHHYLGPASVQHQRAVPRIDFLQSEYYKGLSVNKLYTRTQQRSAFVKILGSEKLADALISKNTTLYLARGHLAAKSDFVFGSHQLATFYFINVVPQWQSFNEGNWLSIEIDLKKYVARRNIDAELYTGSHDVVQYKDVNGRMKKMYLSTDKQSRIPVPKLLYKIIVVDKLKEGIVLIGVNDPYAIDETIKKNYVICKDVADQVRYISWNRTNVTAGYSYACSVDDFMEKVPLAPRIPNASKLTLLL